MTTVLFMLIFLPLNGKLSTILTFFSQSVSRLYLHFKMQNIMIKLLHIMKSVVKKYDKGP